MLTTNADWLTPVPPPTEAAQIYLQVADMPWVDMSRMEVVEAVVKACRTAQRRPSGTLQPSPGQQP